MKKNFFKLNATPEEIRQQNRRARDMLKRWGEEPDLPGDKALIEAEIDSAAIQIPEPILSQRPVTHVPVA